MRNCVRLDICFVYYSSKVPWQLIKANYDSFVFIKEDMTL